MSKLDQVLLRAKQFANVATKKTSAAVEISKLKLQVVQINSLIQSTYERIGTLVYEQEKSGTENGDLISVCVKEIDSLLVELGEINSRISDLKKGVKCSACGALNPPETSYCSVCGANMQKRPVTRSGAHASSRVQELRVVETKQDADGQEKHGDKE